MGKMPKRTAKTRQASEQDALSPKIRNWCRAIKALTALVGQGTVLVTVLSSIPHATQKANIVKPLPPSEMVITPYRDQGTYHAVALASIHIKMPALDADGNNFVAEVVDEWGLPVWHGTANRIGDSIETNVPPINKKGTYYFRLYPGNHKNLNDELLWECKILIGR